MCTRQVAHRTSFLSRQCDVIASFSFWCVVCAHRILCEEVFFCDFHPTTLEFDFYFCVYTFWRIYRPSCPHLNRRGALASFDGHSFCARYRDKGKGKDPCIETPANDCKFCLALMPEQLAQLATPSYKRKKEIMGSKKVRSNS